MIKRFLGDSFLYILVSMFTKGIGFLLLPLYVSHLSQVEYGQFDYLSAVILLCSVLVCTEISQGVLRYVADVNVDDQDKALFISSSVYYTFLCYCIFITLISTLSEKISLIMFETTAHSDLVIYAAFACFSHSVLYLCTVVFRAKLLVKNAVFLSASSALLVAIFAFYFLVVEDEGLVGVFLAQILGQVLASIAALIMLRKHFSYLNNIKPLAKLLSFSFPLVFSSVGVIISMFADRVLIKELLNLESLAIYSVAAKVASVAAIGVMGFQNALAPLIYNQLNSPDLNLKIKFLSKLYLILTIVGTSVLFFSADYILLLVSSEQYLAGSDVLVILCCAVLVQAAVMFFPGLSIEGKTMLLSKLNILSAVLNIILNMIMIPYLGIQGAAISTLISAFVYLVLNAFYSEKYYPIFKRLSN